MRKLTFLIPILLLILTACNGASDAPVVAELPTSTLLAVPSQTARVTATIRPTNTPLPTFTYTPTLTQIPPTETLTLTPSLTPTVFGIVSSIQPINVRSEPNTGSSIIIALPAGEGIEIIGQNTDGTWYNIRLDDGREGWMDARFIRVEPSPTPFPSMTPSPDLTALFLGTPLAPTELVSGRASATPPNQVRTGTPQATETIPPVQTQGALPGVPTIDNNAIYQTATALAGGLRAPTDRPTTEGTVDRSITLAPNSTAIAPQASATATGRRVRVFAYCDDPSYGTDLATVPIIRAGDTVLLWWGWFARTQDQVSQHLQASNLELRVNGELINGANDLHGATQPSGGLFVTYWEVPFGPVASGQYVVTYQVTWDSAIFDGDDFYGPDTPNPFHQESCTFTVP